MWSALDRPRLVPVDRLEPDLSGDVPRLPDPVRWSLRAGAGLLGAETTARAAGRVRVNVWIINLIDNRIEVYTDPTPAYGYRTRVDYQPGDHILIVIDTRVCGRISVPDLLSARVERHDEVRPS